MLKRTVDTLDGIDAGLHSFYENKGGKFHLKVDDAAPLLNARDREKARADAAEARLAEIDAAKATADAAELAKKNKTAAETGDVATLEKSWSEKYNNREKELNSEADTLRAQLVKEKGEGLAASLAAKISTKPKVILPHIEKRIKVEFDKGVAVTRILDKGGKPSALTLAELEAEFVADDDFADIIIASRATGGSATVDPLTKVPGGSAKPVDLTKLSPKELAAHAKRVGLKRMP